MQKIDWKFYYHRSWLPQVDECVKYQESFDYIVKAEARYSLFLRLLELKLIHASKTVPWGDSNSLNSDMLQDAIQRQAGIKQKSLETQI